MKATRQTEVEAFWYDGQDIEALNNFLNSPNGNEFAHAYIEWIYDFDKKRPYPRIGIPGSTSAPQCNSCLSIRDWFTIFEACWVTWDGSRFSTWNDEHFKSVFNEVKGDRIKVG